jgi:N-methylhydantoinase B/oxoprolinase/acetone carboxylase alpha subunit
VQEVRFPLHFRRHEFRPDSGGEGRHRGGPGGELELVIETAEPAVGNTAGDGVKYGACGCWAARTASRTVIGCSRPADPIGRSRPRRRALC